MELRGDRVFWRLRILALSEFCLSWNLLEISFSTCVSCRNIQIGFILIQIYTLVFCWIDSCLSD